jgi:hypothetical protein
MMPLVVRGGKNLPENFEQGSGVSIDKDRKLDGVSVNSAAEASVNDLTTPTPQTAIRALSIAMSALPRLAKFALPVGMLFNLGPRKTHIMRR